MFEDVRNKSFLLTFPSFLNVTVPGYALLLLSLDKRERNQLKRQKNKQIKNMRVFDSKIVSKYQNNRRRKFKDLSF